LALACADLADLLVGRRWNRDTSRTSITACVIVLAQEHCTLRLARHAILDIDEASSAVRITLHTQEVRSIQRHCETRITLSQACALLEVPLVTLEVASVAIKWATVAALARSLTRHALVQATVRIGAKWALSLAHCTIKEWIRPIWIAGGAPVAVIIVAF
jgi:hypothetical protein